jgi:hypothetical protein
MNMMKIQYLFMAVTGIALAIPNPANQPTLAQDLIKRQDLVKYQDAFVDLTIFGGLDISLHFVWDCTLAHFVEHTVGAGVVVSYLQSSPGPGSYDYHLVITPNGHGFVPPNSKFNPTRKAVPFRLGDEIVGITFGASAADDNLVVAKPGTWLNPSVINSGLSVTNQATNRTTVATISKFTISQPYYGVAELPPSGTGTGFNSPSDDTTPV